MYSAKNLGFKWPLISLYILGWYSQLHNVLN